MTMNTGTRNVLSVVCVIAFICSILVFTHSTPASIVLDNATTGKHKLSETPLLDRMQATVSLKASDESTAATVSTNDQLIKEQTDEGDNPSVADSIGPAVATPHWPMDYENTTDIGDMLKQRTANIYSLCERHGTEMLEHLMNSNKRLTKKYSKTNNVIIDYKEGVSFCTIAKTGSTYWKSVFLYLDSGEIMNGLKVNGGALKEGKYLSLQDWSKDERRGQFPAFVAVRNPWRRLVSLYQQKIEFFLSPDGLPPDATVKGQAPYKYIRKVCHRQAKNMVTFQDMLECVLRSYETKTANIHWEAAYESCSICDTKFDYIIRVENMMEEGAYVLRQAGIADAETVLKTVRDGTIRDVEKKKRRLLSDYYRDVPKEMIDRLREMYRYELLLFGYPDSPFTA